MKEIRANLFVSTTCAIASILGGSFHQVQALTFNFTAPVGTDQRAINGFAQAGNLWSALFTDPVTININIGFTALGSGILGQASSTQGTISYSSFRNALSNDRTSADDFTAVSNLTSNSAFNLLINRTSNNPNGAGSATPYLDNDGDANNTTIRMTYANAKALGLLNANNSASDASITFSSNFTFDFDRSDGISSGAYDFIGIAAHEIGHALGFISGVDILDYNSSGTYYRDDQFTYVAPLDLFRFSTLSRDNNAIDWTADSRPKYFSLDQGVTALANFSTGQTWGDGNQDSHWKDNLSLGLLDPTAAPRELLSISSNDLRALDVIGWNRVSSTNAVPEPLTILGAMTALGFGIKFKRKLIHSQKSWHDSKSS